VLPVLTTDVTPQLLMMTDFWLMILVLNLSLSC